MKNNGINVIFSTHSRGYLILIGFRNFQDIKLLLQIPSAGAYTKRKIILVGKAANRHKSFLSMCFRKLLKIFERI